MDYDPTLFAIDPRSVAAGWLVCLLLAAAGLICTLAAAPDIRSAAAVGTQPAAATSLCATLPPPSHG